MGRADATSLHSRGPPWNRMDAPTDPANASKTLWEAWKVYANGFARTNDGWTVTWMACASTAKRSNLGVCNMLES